MAGRLQNKLTDSLIRELRSDGQVHILADGGGLCLATSAKTDLITWFFRWDDGKRKRTLAIGHYPIISLREARHARDVIRRMLEVGIDPANEKPKIKQAMRECRDGELDPVRNCAIRAAMDAVDNLQRGRPHVI
jgi:hypothetical protein